jgi:hypothetical protein
MNQLTTIAALPSGSGQAAHLPAEVGEARKPEPAYRGQGGMTHTAFTVIPQVPQEAEYFEWIELGSPEVRRARMDTKGD